MLRLLEIIPFFGTYIGQGLDVVGTVVNGVQLVVGL